MDRMSKKLRKLKLRIVWLDTALAVCAVVVLCLLIAGYKLTYTHIFGEHGECNVLLAFLQAIFAILGLLTVGMLLPFTQRILISSVIGRTIIFLLLFAVGVGSYGYLDLYANRNLGIDDVCLLRDFFIPLNQTIQSFFTSHGGVGEIKDAKDVAGEGLIFYFTFHVLCIVYLVALALDIWGREICNKSSTLFRRATDLICPKRRTHIFWGCSEKALMLAVDILYKKKGSVVFYIDKDVVEPDEREIIVNRLVASCCNWKDVSFKNISEGIMFRNKRTHFFISDDGKHNVVQARRYVECIEETKVGRTIGLLSRKENEVNERIKKENDEGPKENLKKERDALKIRIGELRKNLDEQVYIRLVNSNEREFYGWIDGEVRKYVEMILFKESDKVFENLRMKLLDENHFSMITNGSAAEKFRILFLGLGRNGQDVLGGLTENIQENGREIHVDVIEKDAEKFRRYEALHPDFCRHYNVQFAECIGEVGSDNFYKWLSGRSKNNDIDLLMYYDMVVMCLGNDDLTLSVQTEIKRMYREKYGEAVPAGKYFVQLDDFDVAGFVDMERNGQSGESEVDMTFAKQFIPFGSMEEIYTCSHILQNDVVERLGKLVNWAYCNEYDARGNVTKKSCVGVDGKPIFHKNGYAEFRAEHDQRGNVTRESYFGVDGKPILHKDGFAEFRAEYDACGNLTSESYFGVDGEPILLKDGYAEFRNEYDARGNVTKVSYYGVDGKSILHKDGFAEIRNEYDARGNLTKRSCFGVDGKLTMCKDGFAGWGAEYDEFGRETCRKFFDVDGKPIFHKNGYAEFRAEHDQRGNVTRESYFGVDGKPILFKNGYAEFRTEYDARGNATRESYFGVDGKPILHKNGFAEIRNEYDARGNVTKQSYYGVDGEPILLKDGYAELRNEYDARGNLTKRSCFGVDGKLTMCKDGFAEIRLEYNEDGCQTKAIKMFDDKGEEIIR